MALTLAEAHRMMQTARCLFRKSFPSLLSGQRWG
jgi:hypothetical protein